MEDLNSKIVADGVAPNKEDLVRGVGETASAFEKSISKLEKLFIGCKFKLLERMKMFRHVMLMN